MIYFIAFNFLCGFISAGFEYAYYQDEYKSISYENRSEDMEFALRSIYWGVIALMVTYETGSYKHGWRLWNNSSQ